MDDRWSTGNAWSCNSCRGKGFVYVHKRPTGKQFEYPFAARFVFRCDCTRGRELNKRWPIWSDALATQYDARSLAAIIEEQKAIEATKQLTNSNKDINNTEPNGGTEQTEAQSAPWNF